MASALEVARLAKVSRSQVSNYFNHPQLVSSAVNGRIRAAIDELGYVPNEAARRLRRGQSENIGVVLLDAWSPFFSEVSRGIEGEAERRGWSVQFSNSDHSAERERRHLEYYEAHMAQGVIVFTGADIGDRLVRLSQRGISAVLLDPPHARSTIPPVPSIAVDHLLGGALAAEHLIERGARRLAFVGNPGSVTHVTDRYDGFRRAVRAVRPRARVGLVETPASEIQYGTEAAQTILDMPRASRPDGLFASNDLVALGLLHGLTAAGIGVPEQVRIVGYDDIYFAAQVATPLTTVRQPAHQLGQLAARMVIDRITEPPAQDQHLILAPELVVRSST